MCGLSSSLRLLNGLWLGTKGFLQLGLGWTATRFALHAHAHQRRHCTEDDGGWLLVVELPFLYPDEFSCFADSLHFASCSGLD